jgi:hypothetical protein
LDFIEAKLLASYVAGFDTFSFDFMMNTALFAYQTSSFNSDLLTLNPFAFFGVNQKTNYLSFSFTDFDPVLISDFLLASFKVAAIDIGTDNFTFEQ